MKKSAVFVRGVHVPQLMDAGDAATPEARPRRHEQVDEARTPGEESVARLGMDATRAFQSGR